MGTVEEKNKEIVRQMYELYNQHDVDAANEMFSPDFHFRDFTREQIKQIDTMLHNAFPDFQCSIIDIVAEGDKVAHIVNATGTHTGGPFMGIPPTGKKTDITNTWIVKIGDSKIVEFNGTASTLIQLQQLGVIPTIPEAIQAYKKSHNLE